jgi:hypothetical protein
MKKFRYQSLVGICFIFLFLVNVFLVITCIVVENSWLPPVAILLSVLQLILHHLFKRKHNVLKHTPHGQSLLSFVRSINPFKGNKASLLTKPEPSLILKDSENQPAAIISVSYQKLGGMGLEVVFCAKEPISTYVRDLRVKTGAYRCNEARDSSIVNIGELLQYRLNNPPTLTSNAHWKSKLLLTNWN